MSEYTIPPQTRIGHVHLKVANLERSLCFYQGILGFQVTQFYGDSSVFLSAGEYHHHIGLNTWHSKGAVPASEFHTGLFHVALWYPTRKDLALILQRLNHLQYPLTGAADHGVSEALYLNDPDENGIELYCDRPRTQWPTDAMGNVNMVTKPLRLASLLAELQ